MFGLVLYVSHSKPLFHFLLEFVSDDLDFVKDSKEAEHAAAKGAFTFLSLDCFQKESSPILFQSYSDY